MSATSRQSKGSRMPQLTPFRWPADSLRVQARVWHGLFMWFGDRCGLFKMFYSWGRLLTNFPGGVGIRTNRAVADTIHPQSWALPAYCFSQRKHHMEGNMAFFLPLLCTHVLKVHTSVFVLFTRLAFHGDELSLYISLCDYFFRAHLSCSGLHWGHSPLLNS